MIQIYNKKKISRFCRKTKDFFATSKTDLEGCVLKINGFGTEPSRFHERWFC